MKEIQTWFYMTGHSNVISVHIYFVLDYMATLGWSQRAYEEHHLEVLIGISTTHFFLRDKCASLIKYYKYKNNSVLLVQYAIYLVYKPQTDLWTGKVMFSFKVWFHICMQTLTRHLLYGLLTCDICGIDCPVITTEYRARVHWIHT